MNKPTCQFLISEDGRQVPCGQIATHSRRTRDAGIFYYCQTHADQAIAALKRAGKTLILDVLNFQPEKTVCLEMATRPLPDPK